MPIDPPMLRIMLKSAEAAPLSRPLAMPDVVTAESGVMMSGWPNARIMSGMTNCGTRAVYLAESLSSPRRCEKVP
jgi:hypothetical protein